MKRSYTKSKYCEPCEPRCAIKLIPNVVDGRHNALRCLHSQSAGNEVILHVDDQKRLCSQTKMDTEPYGNGVDVKVLGCGLSDVLPHDANPSLFSRPDCFLKEQNLRQLKG